MKYAIDETELARLEELAAHYANVVTLDNVSIPHQIIKAVPALVAEVRRMREKVEAWEWFEECFEVMQWLVPMGPNRADGCTEAVMSTLHAQKGAVHADRE